MIKKVRRNRRIALISIAVITKNLFIYPLNRIFTAEDSIRGKAEDLPPDFTGYCSFVFCLTMCRPCHPPLTFSILAYITELINIRIVGQPAKGMLRELPSIRRSCRHCLRCRYPWYRHSSASSPCRSMSASGLSQRCRNL